MRKYILYFKLSIFYILRNKIRCFLTMFGVLIGLVIFLLGNVCVGAYIDSLYEEATHFEQNSYLIVDGEGEFIDKLKKENEEFIFHSFAYTGDYLTIPKTYEYKEKQIKESTELFGMETGLSNQTIPFLDNNMMLLSKTKILYGRDLSSADRKESRNVIVIEKSASKGLFLKENSVGEFIEVISPYGYMEFEVIGVIEDLPSRRRKNLIFNKELTLEDSTEVSHQISGYIPLSTLKKMVNGEIPVQDYILQGNEENAEKLQETMDLSEEQAERMGKDVGIKSQRSLLNDVRTTELQLEGLFNILLLIIILISGFMIMTIYIFSIKERMYEIGIRRAIGASGFDIIKQFLFEGIMTALFAGILTILFGAVICNFITSYLMQTLFMDIQLVMRKEIILGTLGLSILEGVIFSFIPALIAAKVRPTEAIRWD